MIKQIIDKDTLAPKIIAGMGEIASIVKRTLGPGGLPILIQRLGQSLDGTPLAPKITKDGVSVGDECASDDPIKDLIIQSVKAICKKTNTVAGDGTTTAIVLGEAILNEAVEMLSTDPKLNAQLVRESIEQVSKDVIKELQKMATPVEDNNIIRQVATISANGDPEIGDILGEAFDSVGAEGVITIDEGHTNRITLEIVEGYQFNRGAEGRDRFFNDADKVKFEAENAALIIYDGKLLNYTDLIPALQVMAGIEENGKPTKKLPPIVVVANEFSHEVIQFLLIQRAEMGLQFCAVKGPHTTHVRTGYYEDMAVMSGGIKLGNGSRSLRAFEDGDAGLISRIIIDKYKTTMYDGQGDEEKILKRVDQLKAMKKLAESPYDAQVINDRLAALTNGIAKIGVGGATEFEIKEKYDRIEDALNSSKAAVDEGIVPGGGIALYRISEKLKGDTIGEKILKKALKSPFFQILENVGVRRSNENLEKLLKNKELTYDARNKKIVNALESGIIDPVKVTRSALENAVSIASLLCTAGGAIIYKKDK